MIENLRKQCPKCEWVGFALNKWGLAQLERQFKGHVAAKHAMGLLFNAEPLNAFMPIWTPEIGPATLVLEYLWLNE